MKKFQQLLASILLVCLVTLGALKVSAQSFTQNWATLTSGVDNSSYAITMDASGNIFTANKNATISKITPDGTVTQAWATLTNQINPTAIVIDGLGNIYTANHDSYSISKITPSGVVTPAWVSFTERTITPTGIAIDASNNLYVSEDIGGKIIKITPSGAVNLNWATVDAYPTGGITMDGSGNLYTCNFLNSTCSVSKITPAGVVTKVWATLPYGAHPMGIITDASGNVYTANQNTNTISKITPAGVCTQTWASTGDYPTGLAIDGVGNLYTGNYYDISKITPSGVCTQPWISYSGTGPWCMVINKKTGYMYAGNDDNTVSKIQVSAPINTAPTFTGGTTLTVCQNSTATSINSLLSITDADASQTETFSVTTQPNHGGTITTGTTASSGTNVSPTGWNYTPANGFSGTETFTIQVSDGTATVSTTVTVTVNAATAITTQPVNPSVCAGSDISLSVAATGSGTLSYQWNYSINGGTTYQPVTDVTGSITGSTTSTLTLKGVPALSSGTKFRCTVTGGCGTATSTSNQQISVNPTFGITASAGTGGSISSSGTTQVCKYNGQFYSITPSSGYNVASVLVDGVDQGAITYYNFSNVQTTHTITATFALQNTAPVFVGGANQAFTICQDASAVDLTQYIKITDADAGQTETYNVTYTTGSLYGTLTQGNLTVGSGTGVAASGWTYQPNKGFSGTDQFILQVSDGNGGTATTHVVITVNPAPFLNVIGNTTDCGSVTLIGVGDGPNYSWDGGSSPITGANTFGTSGKYTVTATGTNGCTSSISKDVTVIPAVTPSVSIVSDATGTIVSGSNVTFTATPINGGTPSYQWKKNGSVVGNNSNTYSDASLSDGDIITVTLNSTATCAVPASVTSNSIQVSVDNIPFFANGHQQTLTICHDNLADLSTTFNLSINDWDVNQTETFTTLSQPTHGTLSAGTTAISTGGSVQPSNWIYTPTAGFSGTDQFTVKVDDGVGGSDTTTVVVTVIGVPNAGTITAPASTVCGNGGIVQLTSNGDAGGTWTQSDNQSLYIDYYTGQAQGFPNNGATGTEVETITYTVQNTCGDQATSTFPLTVIFDAFAGNISANTDAEICPNSSMNFFIVGGDAGGTWTSLNPEIATVDNKGNVTGVSEGYGVFKYEVTNACSTASTTSAVIVDHPYHPTVTIDVDNNPFIPGSTVNFSANFDDAGSISEYDWYKNGTLVSVNELTYSDNTLAKGDQIKLSINTVNNCQQAASFQSNVITMKVTCVPNGSVVTATGCGSYLWHGTTYTTSGTYTYKTTNAGGCDSTVTLNLTITTPVVPSVRIISSQTGILCAGSAVTLTATASNAGTTPAYQWYNGSTAISGKTTTTYTYTPAAGNADAINVKLSGANNACQTASTATSNSITPVITAKVTPSVSISVAQTGTICSGTLVTINATPTNGGAAPTYQWYKASTAISGATASSYSYIPVAGNKDSVNVKIVANNACQLASTAVSKYITPLITLPVTPVVAIGSTPTGTICSGTAVTFNATIAAGGTSPTYQWYKGSTAISGATATSYNYIPAPGNADSINVKLTANNTCQTANVVTSKYITPIITATVTPSVTVAATQSGTLCSGKTVTIAASPLKFGSAPQYQWFNGSTAVTGVTTQSYYSYTPTVGNSDVISVVVTGANNACQTASTAKSNSVTPVITITQSVSPSVSVTTSQSGVLCSGTSLTLNAIPANAGTSPSFQWYTKSTAIVGATASSYSYTPTVGNTDSISVRLTANNTCQPTNVVNSKTITPVVVTTVTPSVSIVSAQTGGACSIKTVTFNATPVKFGSSPQYQWFNGTTALTAATTQSYYSYKPAVGNTDAISVVVTGANNTCQTASTAQSASITPVISAPLTPSIPTVNIVANPGSSVTTGTSVAFTVGSLTGVTTPTYQWYKGSTAISGATTSSYSYAPANKDVISLKISGPDSTCQVAKAASSNSITIAVTAPVATISENRVASESAGIQASLYPNPSHGSASVKLQGVTSAITITVRGIYGNTIATLKASKDGEVKLPAQSLASGLYIVSINDGITRKDIKWVKN